MTLLPTTILWMFIIHLFLIVHFYVIEYRKKTPNHALSFLLAVAVGYWISKAVYSDWILRLVNLLYLGLVYWMVFPLLLNFFRQVELLRLGDKAFLDRLEAKAKNPGGTLGLKFILAVICAFYILNHA